MIKKIILLVFLVGNLAGCKTFIMASEQFDWNYYGYFGMSEKMCIKHGAISNNDNKKFYCDLEKNTIDVTKLNEYTYIFPINREFLSSGFIDYDLNAEFDKELDEFKAKKLREGMRFGLDEKDKRDKKRYIKKRTKETINELFPVAYKRLNDNPYNYKSGIGMGFKTIKHMEEGEKDITIAEVFFVDMHNDNKIIDRSVFGYITSFQTGHGGINIRIPTCYVSRGTRKQGCKQWNKKRLANTIRKALLEKFGRGKSVFDMSFSIYIPAPKEPKAKGVPLNI